MSYMRQACLSRLVSRLVKAFSYSMSAMYCINVAAGMCLGLYMRYCRCIQHAWHEGGHSKAMHVCHHEQKVQDIVLRMTGFNACCSGASPSAKPSCWRQMTQSINGGK